MEEIEDESAELLHFTKIRADALLHPSKIKVKSNPNLITALQWIFDLCQELAHANHIVAQSAWAYLVLVHYKIDTDCRN